MLPALAKNRPQIKGRAFPKGRGPALPCGPLFLGAAFSAILRQGAAHRKADAHSFASSTAT